MAEPLNQNQLTKPFIRPLRAKNQGGVFATFPFLIFWACPYGPGHPLQVRGRASLWAFHCCPSRSSVPCLGLAINGDQAPFFNIMIIIDYVDGINPKDASEH
jgi:hypothetical protein